MKQATKLPVLAVFAGLGFLPGTVGGFFLVRNNAEVESQDALKLMRGGDPILAALSLTDGATDAVTDWLENQKEEEDRKIKNLNDKLAYYNKWVDEIKGTLRQAEEKFTDETSSPKDDAKESPPHPIATKIEKLKNLVKDVETSEITATSPDLKVLKKSRTDLEKTRTQWEDKNKELDNLPKIQNQESTE